MRKLNAASDLYENFTGHRANTVEKRQLAKGGVFLKIGYLDFLKLANGQEIQFAPKSTELLSSHDGLSFHGLGNNLIPVNFKTKVKGVPKARGHAGQALVKIKAIGYTTRRDGVIERYIHTFKKKARPQLLFLTRNHLQSLGGVFDFTELGFVDR